MSRTKAPLTLRARWLFPATVPPLADGAVTIVDGRIVSVGPAAAGGAVEDLGNVAILPGLINAHTHLDLSDVPAPLGRQGIALPEWLGQVVAFRRHNPGDNRRAVERGLQECVRGGVTGLGDIAQANDPLDPLAQAPIDGVVFTELIAPTARRVAPALELARQSLLASSPWRLGLAPHAPYSVHPDLLRGAIEISAAQEVPLAFHLAESAEEIDLLRTADGPMRRLLESLDAWEPGAFRPGARPLDFLRLLARAHRTLIIHGNYLDDEEIGFLAKNAAKMAVVYCPRTHARFGHPRYPLEKLLAAGASVAVGTDSRASSPDLSLLAELRHIARSHAIPPQVALQLGTSRAAAALDCDRESDDLASGKWANLAVVALPDHDAADPYELLFASDHPVARTYYRGTAVWPAEHENVLRVES